VGHARLRLGEGRRSVRARVRYEADGCTKFQTTTKRTREQAETWIAEKKSEYDEGCSPVRKTSHLTSKSG
jgi:hypothetical protein